MVGRRGTYPAREGEKGVLVEEVERVDHWGALGQLQQVGHEVREVDIGTLLGALHVCVCV